MGSAVAAASVALHDGHSVEITAPGREADRHAPMQQG
jgi:hypothetical protein